MFLHRVLLALWVEAVGIAEGICLDEPLTTHDPLELCQLMKEIDMVVQPEAIQTKRDLHVE